MKPVSASLTLKWQLCVVLMLAVLTLDYRIGYAANDDTTLDATFYSDGTCYVQINNSHEDGKTIIDADVDELGSRMLLHCDTDQGQRLTLLVRGNTLNAAQRIPFLSKTEMVEGDIGMIAWLTQIGAHYTDESIPRRYVMAGSIIMRKSPAASLNDSDTTTERQSFVKLAGSLEPARPSKK